MPHKSCITNFEKNLPEALIKVEFFPNKICFEKTKNCITPLRIFQPRVISDNHRLKLQFVKSFCDSHQTQQNNNNKL
jgi:hypothetical protein